MCIFLFATCCIRAPFTLVTWQNTKNSCCSWQYIPEYQVNTKECKHDNAVANYPSGITDLVEQEEPFVHQSKGVKGNIWSETFTQFLFLYQSDNNQCLQVQLDCYLGVVHASGLRVARYET